MLDGLANRLMEPDLFKVFVSEFTAEWNRQQASVAGERESRQAELGTVRHKIGIHPVKTTTRLQRGWECSPNAFATIEYAGWSGSIQTAAI